MVPMKRASCRLEPEVKPVKKIVYEAKRVPVCEHRLPPFLHEDCCPKCAACPKYKTVLIKKELECGEKCKLKCVAEETIVWIAQPCRQCGHRPQHPILHHLFGNNSDGGNSSIINDEESLQPFETETPVEPTHVARVPKGMLRSRSSEMGHGVVTAGALLEPGMIETNTDGVEELRQRFMKSAGEGSK